MISATLQHLFESAGFSCDSCVYVQRKTTNKKEGVDVDRIFVQGRFRKVSQVKFCNGINGINEELSTGHNLDNHSSANGNHVTETSAIAINLLPPTTSSATGIPAETLAHSGSSYTDQMPSSSHHIGNDSLSSLLDACSKPSDSDCYKPLSDLAQHLKSLHKSRRKNKTVVVNFDDSTIDRIRNVVHIHWESKFKGCADWAGKIFDWYLQLEHLGELEHENVQTSAKVSGNL